MLLLLAAAASDPAMLLLRARSRLAVPCRGADCAPLPRRSAYRIDADGRAPITAKDRAIGDDGTKCNVVGARRCSSHGRTIFRTSIDQ